MLSCKQYFRTEKNMGLILSILEHLFELLYFEAE